MLGPSSSSTSSSTSTQLHPMMNPLSDSEKLDAVMELAQQCFMLPANPTPSLSNGLHRNQFTTTTTEDATTDSSTSNSMAWNHDKVDEMSQTTTKLKRSRTDFTSNTNSTSIQDLINEANNGSSCTDNDMDDDDIRGRKKALTMTMAMVDAMKSSQHANSMTVKMGKIVSSMLESWFGGGGGGNGNGNGNGGLVGGLVSSEDAIVNSVSGDLIGGNVATGLKNNMKRKSNQFPPFPSDILLCLFHHLDATTLCEATRVSKTWNALVSTYESTFWSDLCIRRYRCKRKEIRNGVPVEGEPSPHNQQQQQQQQKRDEGVDLVMQARERRLRGRYWKSLYATHSNFDRARFEFVVLGNGEGECVELGGGVCGSLRKGERNVGVQMTDTGLGLKGIGIVGDGKGKDRAVDFGYDYTEKTTVPVLPKTKLKKMKRKYVMVWPVNADEPYQICLDGDLLCWVDPRDPLTILVAELGSEVVVEVEEEGCLAGDKDGDVVMSDVAVAAEAETIDHHHEWSHHHHHRTEGVSSSSSCSSSSSGSTSSSTSPPSSTSTSSSTFDSSTGGISSASSASTLTNDLEPTGRLQGHEHPIGLLLSNGKGILVSFDERSKIYVWDLSTKTLIRRLNNDNRHDYIHSMHVNGNRVVAGSKEGIITVWDLFSGDVVWEHRIPKRYWRRLSEQTLVNVAVWEEWVVYGLFDGSFFVYRLGEEVKNDEDEGAVGGVVGSAGLGEVEVVRRDQYRRRDEGDGNRDREVVLMPSKVDAKLVHVFSIVMRDSDGSGSGRESNNGIQHGRVTIAAGAAPLNVRSGDEDGMGTGTGDTTVSSLSVSDDDDDDEVEGGNNNNANTTVGTMDTITTTDTTTTTTTATATITTTDDDNDNDDDFSSVMHLPMTLSFNGHVMLTNGPRCDQLSLWDLTTGRPMYTLSEEDSLQMMRFDDGETTVTGANGSRRGSVVSLGEGQGSSAFVRGGFGAPSSSVAAASAVGGGFGSAGGFGRGFGISDQQGLCRRGSMMTDGGSGSGSGSGDHHDTTTPVLSWSAAPSIRSSPATFAAPVGFGGQGSSSGIVTSDMSPSRGLVGYADTLMPPPLLPHLSTHAHGQHVHFDVMASTSSESSSSSSQQTGSQMEDSHHQQGRANHNNGSGMLFPGMGMMGLGPGGNGVNTTPTLPPSILAMMEREIQFAEMSRDGSMIFGTLGGASWLDGLGGGGNGGVGLQQPPVPIPNINVVPP
ncbi:hypothetical protein HDU76_006399, partial [Blyttiomyces sp. JEL0837]